jgi:hypothetical protein
MASPLYNLMLSAAKTLQQVVCDYHGYRREICPHVIGLGANGEEMILAYQFGGGSSRGLPSDGEWRCFRLQEVSNAKPQSGALYTNNSHLRPQTCVKRVEFEVPV